ncbi:MAG: HepT-like ribonuclease domain-containing protein [Phycisphaerae bacterium]|jgi:uncharacterized protein with HEPN domain
MQRNLSLILDLARACRQIIQFTAEMNFESFRTDNRTQSAVIHQFLVIGEIAKLLSDDFKKANTEIQWSAMARMRDKLIHHYRGVDLHEIWKTAQAEIPRLLLFAEKHLPKDNT